ncbi:MAG TPA: hypothetical protein VNB06_08230, partial [Thermoanaerobaculia bacterium]|nr:hypothetical protein [Thermoanaerobaculia bacterium]
FPAHRMSIRPHGAPNAAHGGSTTGCYSTEEISDGREERYVTMGVDRPKDPEVLRQQNINLDLDEVIARGDAAHPQARVRWVAHTGDVGGAGRSGQSGLVTLLLFERGEGDHRLRFGIWYAPDPRLETGDETASLEGTPADGAAVEAFVAPFRPCG